MADAEALLRAEMDAPLGPSSPDELHELKRQYNDLVAANDPKTRWQEMCVTPSSCSPASLRSMRRSHGVLFATSTTSGLPLSPRPRLSARALAHFLDLSASLFSRAP